MADGRVTLNAALFMTKIDGLQVIADAGSCSSRIILNADAETQGAEIELFVRPDEHWDLGLSATYVKAEITETQSMPTASRSRAFATATACRPRPSCRPRPGRPTTGRFGSRWTAIVRLTVQHVGSSFTQLADQEPNFGLISHRAASPVRRA